MAGVAGVELLCRNGMERKEQWKGMKNGVGNGMEGLVYGGMEWKEGMKEADPAAASRGGIPPRFRSSQHRQHAPAAARSAPYFDGEQVKRTSAPPSVCRALRIHVLVDQHAVLVWRSSSPLQVVNSRTARPAACPPAAG